MSLPPTSNHHPCHCHKMGAKDGPNSQTRREGTPNHLVRWGQKQAWVGNGQKKKRCLARAQRANAPPQTVEVRLMKTIPNSSFFSSAMVLLSLMAHEGGAVLEIFYHHNKGADTTFMFAKLFGWGWRWGTPHGAWKEVARVKQLRRAKP